MGDWEEEMDARTGAKRNEEEFSFPQETQNSYWSAFLTGAVNHALQYIIRTSSS